MRRVLRHPKVLRRRALKIQQNDQHPLYLFCLTGTEILSLADISRLSRNDAGKLIGYQRPQVKRHIQDIVTYLNGENIIFPNSLILALSSDVKFKATRGPQGRDNLVIAGTLEIPIPTNGARPAWIVDGQQRALAISKSRRSELPIPVNAFVADEIELQRDQFLRVNNTKPLQRAHHRTAARSFNALAREPASKENSVVDLQSLEFGAAFSLLWPDCTSVYDARSEEICRSGGHFDYQDDSR